MLRTRDAAGLGAVRKLMSVVEGVEVVEASSREAASARGGGALGVYDEKAQSAWLVMLLVGGTDENGIRRYVG